MQLPPDMVQDMRHYCRDASYFGLQAFMAHNPKWHGHLSYHDVNGPPRFAAGTLDAYRLMEAVLDEFDFTEDGYDSFLIDKRPILAAA